MLQTPCNMLQVAASRVIGQAVTPERSQHALVILVDKTKASIDRRAVPQDPVVSKASKSAGREQRRPRPYFGDPCARLMGTIGVVGVMDQQKRQWILEIAGDPADIGIDQRSTESAVETVLQTGADSRSEPMPIGEKIEVGREVAHRCQKHHAVDGCTPRSRQCSRLRAQ
jgi:hypothetical protein